MYEREGWRAMIHEMKYIYYYLQHSNAPMNVKERKRIERASVILVSTKILTPSE